MKSIFPGMDPLLESSWSDAHTSLCTYTRDQLQTKLPHDLRARLEEQVQLTLPEDEVTGRIAASAVYHPNVQITESEFATNSSVTQTADIRLSTAKPHVVNFQPKNLFRRISVIERPTDRLITTIEFICPEYKSNTRRRLVFHERQEELLDAGVNLVEIDLVRAGEWTMFPDEDFVPQVCRNPYRIIVVRAELPDEAECYEVKLSEPLPTIAIPLRPTDQDVALEIQPLVSEAFEKAAYSTSDYERAPLPSYSAEENTWVMNRLTAAGIYRSPSDADQKAR
ncbi:hypothetical protein Plim_2443 [Planctopirus limnophila DSM 3776]|uniref:DUF4058 family protein n=1 Tax=Planctopirus limnophila (strain ATCC 43296 / DSM 3776 / IFAM 1008 / Mu 290) TaxID=521674 RepID=D5SPC5_PLAL2|nr:DUF4058 family protein [Planctopirus limnophila]ADG68269.1 hypothetical protein Plim_2443 [Planctopirus limnophila DSM 3776]